MPHNEAVLLLLFCRYTGYDPVDLGTEYGTYAAGDTGRSRIPKKDSGIFILLWQMPGSI